MKRLSRNAALALNLWLLQPVFANGLQVSNIGLTGQNTAGNYTHVQFDITWQNSWRTSTAPTNWDAAWVFVKYSVAGNPWQHATLVTSGHTAPSGSTITTSGDGKGVFIYRSSDGTGTVNFTGVQLRWHYGIDGVADNATVKVKVFAIEMVYVPTGNFWAGSGGTGTNEFSLTLINTANATQAPVNAGIWFGGYPVGQTAPANASWPNGFSAFYCMKYEITQEQYADFLNCLTSTQAAARNPGASTFRYSITGSHPNFSSSRPFVACNFLSWMDGCAYADWAGLRPMTELEFEKACRGTTFPVPDEYAWGTTNITVATGITNEGAANEVASNAGANCACGNQVPGPMRVGCFATSSSSREQAGASFYGIMNLGDNLYEPTVTIANADGRNFIGTSGEGSLSTNGNATNSDWPGFNNGEVTGSTGGGYRGGRWSHPLTVSNRGAASNPTGWHASTLGFRCVRFAP